MRTYRIGLKHDNGEVEIRIMADSIQSAKEQVMTAEKCPERAITYWAVVPTKKEIQRAKNILRGI